MPNMRIEGHPLVGATRVYHANLPAYDPDDDTEGGTLIIGNGYPVTIKAVFTDWNGVPGLDMLAVFVHATGYHTHIPPLAVGLGAISSTGVSSLVWDTETGEHGFGECAWFDVPYPKRSEWARFDCWGRAGKAGDGMYSVLCEGHFNRQSA